MKNESTHIYDISFRKFWHVIIFDTEVDGSIVAFLQDIFVGRCQSNVKRNGTYETCILYTHVLLW